MNQNVRNYKAMAEQDERSQPTGRVSLYGVLVNMRGKPFALSSLTPIEARRVASELLAAAQIADTHQVTEETS